MQIAARADLCRLLAACYYEPSPEFGEEQIFVAMEHAGAAIDADLAVRARRLGDAFGANDLQQLRIDYTRLFLGPIAARASPYGSIWLGNADALMQDSTMAVLGLYADGGFDMDESFREVPDHIAAELEFLYLLLFREGEARLNGDDEALRKVLDLRHAFLSAHLGRWVTPFAAAVRSGAETDFYRVLADLTESFVAAEIARGGSGSGSGNDNGH